MKISVIIATRDRPNMLKTVLNCLAQQTFPVFETIVIDSSSSPSTKNLCQSRSEANLVYLRSEHPSAACQRNDGINEAKGDLLAFMDDDIEFEEDLLENMVTIFRSHSEAGALSPRMRGSSFPPPGYLLRLYFLIQAGFYDPTYGARLFGAGINCYPCYEKQKEPLISSDWLPTTCLFVRKNSLGSKRFPEFDGYSFAEDVHLTSRIAKESSVYFCRETLFDHHSAEGVWKQNTLEQVRNQIANRERIAQEILGLTKSELLLKSLLHRAFMTLAILRHPHRNMWTTWRGLWSFK
jgi:glycosyltransferase involved in cell wall biosynthesis